MISKLLTPNQDSTEIKLKIIKPVYDYQEINFATSDISYLPSEQNNKNPTSSSLSNLFTEDRTETLAHLA